MWIIVFYKLFHLIVDTTCLGIHHAWWEWIAKPLSGPVSGVDGLLIFIFC